MQKEGPVLETLTRRLAECPGEFLAAPFQGGQGTVHVDAVICDLLRDLGGQPLTAEETSKFQYPACGHNRLKAILVAGWLLRDAWFAGRTEVIRKIPSFLVSDELEAIARMVPATDLVSDADRREELVRLCLARLGLRPAGESAIQAQDRLTALSSVERARVARETRQVEERARRLRAQIARKAREEEAAAKVTRE